MEKVLLDVGIGRKLPIAQLWHLISYENEYFNAIDTREKIINHCEELCRKLNENAREIYGALEKVGLSKLSYIHHWWVH